MLKWFYSKEDREISQWSEFCEELLTPGLIDKHEFRFIDYSYATTVQTPIKKAKKLDMQEILVFEIFDLIPTHSQLRSLEQLHAQGNTINIKWADRLLIKNLGFNEHTKTTAFEIGAHTKWAVLEEWTDD
ncbi:MAG: hypothetical protein EOP45_12265 [Sphingobacteriaceae bacterium]|nr:MAG: hypothetical protein EOP45_12265 [Sphingobacteriaceae bacterium]